MIILFCGQPSSGKTTLADALCERMGSDVTIRIDGDKWRDVTNNKDYSREGRVANLKGAFDMAVYLEREGYIPVLSFVAPYDSLRAYLDEKSTELIQVYLEYSEDRGRSAYFVSDFEQPNGSYLKINTSELDIEACLQKIISELPTTHSDRIITML